VSALLRLVSPSRIAFELRRSSSLWQVVRFLLVGGSSYLVNLAAFTIAVEGLHFHHLAGAAVAFCCAVSNSFFGHRLWTFRAADQRVVRQAVRFMLVCLPAAVLAAGLLQLGVAAGLPKVLAQALAVATAAPFSFTAYRLWSFAPILSGSAAEPARR
jgi:putative flippase GtrA